MLVRSFAVKLVSLQVNNTFKIITRDPGDNSLYFFITNSGSRVAKAA